MPTSADSAAEAPGLPLCPRPGEYPQALAEFERECLHTRRAAAQEPPPSKAAPVLGLALSGGGIRSATFCLGVLRGLARLNILQRVDFLSTVSGGGYAGSFLGALIQRRGLKGAVDTLTRTPPEPANGGEPKPRPPADATTSFPIRWLRDNGRYLAPNGSGDALLMGSILLRNWVAMHLVLGTLFLGVMLALKSIWVLPGAPNWIGWTAREGARIWWSPWLLAPIATFFLWVIPPGWAYWLVEGKADAAQRKGPSPIQVVAVCTVVAWIWLVRTGLPALLQGRLSSWYPKSWVDGLALVIGVEGLLTLAWYLALATREAPGWGESREDAAEGQGADTAALLRWKLSHQISAGIILTLLLGLLAAADSVGQSLYAVWAEGGFKAAKLWATGTFGVLATIALAGRKLAEFLPGKKEDVSLPVSLMASIAAALLLGALFVGHAALATGLTWGFQPVNWPTSPAATVGRVLIPPPPPAPQKVAIRLEGESSGRSGQVEARVEVQAGEPASPPPSGDPWARLWFMATAICVLLSWLAFSRNRAFLNLSAMGGFYQKRLTRSYLGASNPEREAKPTSPREELPKDDLRFNEYQPWTKGGPIHLINVTINETLDGQSHIQNQDRKGTPMAVGAGGISVGVRHHAAWAGADRTALREAAELKGLTAEEHLKRFGVFKPLLTRPEEALKPQALTLGQWMGISGAAFSTGMGFRTSFGLSLLCGFFNVRTGYWWQSGTDAYAANPGLHKGAWHLFSKALPVQAHFVDEWFARFHGTSRRNWYLSDGGHFENTGVYELVRRRVPTILLCDAGADGGYVFDDLANLTLKLRSDFGAELRLLEDPGELFEKMNEVREALGLAKLPEPPKAEPLPAFGPWRYLRRGDWEGGSGKEAPRALKKADAEGFSLAHATLAEIRYPVPADAPEAAASDRTLLLIFKPALTGDEPLDVMYYHAQHPAFPHESTLDQFFDEAQWEAYRKLGEHAVAEVL